MKVAWPWAHRPAAVPPDVASAVPLLPKERLLASERDTNTGGWVTATSYRLLVVLPERSHLLVERRWHEVEQASWQAEMRTLSVTWVTRGRAGQWTFEGEARALTGHLRELVTRSVVVREPLAVDGADAGWAVLRRDLETGDVFAQVWLRPGVRGNDPAVAAAVRAAKAGLMEQVGRRWEEDPR